MRPAYHRVAAALLTLLTVASLGLLGWRQLAPPPIVVAETATLAGLTTQVQRAEWVPLDHVHDGEGGFLMPDQMMPGAPAGDEVRLGVSLTIYNRSARPQTLHVLDEYTVVGGRTSTPAALRADTVSDLPRLAAGTAVAGVLYFDLVVPSAADPPLHLQWRRGGRIIQLPIPLSGTGTDHHS
ncbi:hypothetical protein JQS43_09670 [Natronosporangium hydrolyticum]|uniref:DUF4352 domain-containing protein n=1 Tax=Natronosporangium hydrolyticum TaxID=2811111 RepID=A0A895YMH6_9ACTN|nr:hypothetical protein [Natronosporangium hydrolyticum]QSB16513.1 hypothetical protein JQS43_09670 [Natronosporangium hydrolyticum]